MLSYIERLQKKYKLSFYDDIYIAIEDAKNEAIGKNENSEQSNAIVAAYTDENKISCVVLIKNIEIEQRISTTTDMVLDLGGKNLIVKDEVAIEIQSGNIKIEASNKGSGITVASNTGGKTNVVVVNGGECTINGGTFESNSNGAGDRNDPNANVTVNGAGILNISNSYIIANDTNDGTKVGIINKENGVVNISNCNIVVSSPNGLGSRGIKNNGTMTISNSNIKSFANYTGNAAGTAYASCSRGIENNGTLTLKNCYVYGDHSGITSKGALYIDGGTYEGYGHGGIYFCASNTNSYVKNANIGECDMAEGYYADEIAGTNHAGFYIGGANNITIYMDNCDIYGKLQPIVMRGTSSEKNNSLYISNSSINLDYGGKGIRIDSTTHRLYIGVGNNFSSKNITGANVANNTEDNYGEQFPEF